MTFWLVCVCACRRRVQQRPRKCHEESGLPGKGFNWSPGLLQPWVGENGGFRESSDLLTLCPTLPGKLGRPVCTLSDFSQQEWTIELLTFFPQHSVLYRGDTVEYRDQCPDIDNVIEAGQDMTPPTPAFPISPPTPYGKFCIAMVA